MRLGPIPQFLHVIEHVEHRIPWTEQVALQLTESYFHLFTAAQNLYNEFEN